MGLREFFLICLGLGLVGFFTYQRLLRGIFFFIVLWAATLMSALIYEPVAYRGVEVGINRPMAEGIVFLLFLTIFSVVGYIIAYKAFPDTYLPKIGILDYVLGFINGVLIALLVVSLILNAVGVMVREQWATNKQGWLKLRTSYHNSAFLSFTRSVINIYRLPYYFFFRTPPAVLVPQ